APRIILVAVLRTSRDWLMVKDVCDPAVGGRENWEFQASHTLFQQHRHLQVPFPLSRSGHRRYCHKKL
ncbi:hypothetical protein A6R68_15548, partial [Neotoma lepida]